MDLSASARLRSSPAARAAAAVQALGAQEFAEWCAAVLTGVIDMTGLITEPDPDPRWLAGRAWTAWGAPDTWVERGLDYWPRVWAARSLLHEWHQCAEQAVTAGLSDEHWRVREMCAKVVTRHDLATAADACADLAAHDGNHRVRICALRAVAVVGEAEHAWPVASALADDREDVRAAADAARARMERRLDRSLTDST